MITKLSEYKLFNELAVDPGPASGNFGSGLLFLYGIALGRNNILEIGHGLGGSTAALVLACKNRVCSIDIKKSSESWLESIKNTEYSRKWHFAQGRSIDILPKCAYNYDLVLIDGEHSYDAVSFELEQCKRLCNPGAIIILDDCWEGYAPGVVKAFNEFTDVFKIKHKQLISYGTKDSYHGLDRTMGLIYL